MRTRLTWIQVPKGTTFLNYGIDIDGEVSFFKIAIIDDMDTVGMVVINPDGDQVSSKVMADAEEIIAGFNYNNVFYEIQLLPSPLAYELTIHTKEEHSDD